MAQNIEIKAYAFDFLAQSHLAAELSEGEGETINQVDTFFNVSTGRLKLREFPDAKAQLIFYRRSNQTGPTLSEYHITETDDPAGLTFTLQKAYGIQATVKKVRQLYMVGRTRLHFDKVESLGEFIELEVVLADQETSNVGESEAEQLMQKLNIEPAHLIDVAYVDLLSHSSK